MSDNRLRCVLVYRLESGSGSGGGSFDADQDGMALSDLSGGSKVGVTVLAKHDHASQYEATGGADSGTLYGGRDKDYAEAVALVIGNDPPAGSSEAGSIGGFKVIQSEMHQVVYGADSDGICK